MSFLKNAISLMAIFSVIPAAYAVTARPGTQANRASVVASAATGAARRMPTMSSYITGTAAYRYGSKQPSRHA